MPGFTRRPLAVFVCCMFVGAQASHAANDVARLQLSRGDLDQPLVSQPTMDIAAVEALRLAVNETPVRLRSERKFNVLGKKKPPLAPDIGLQNPVELKKEDSYPMFVVADHIEGRVDETTLAEGDVELRKAGSLVYADKMIYWPLEDEVDATGHVRILQEGMEVDTPHLRMKLSDQIGFAENADYRMVKEVSNRFYKAQTNVVTAASSNAVAAGAPMMMRVADVYGLPTAVPLRRPSEGNGHAEKIEFEGGNKYRLFDSTYSTCKPGQKDWYLQSSEMALDYDQDAGAAKHVSVWLKDVPIFYSPWASFSLNTKRHSGFLHPYFALSTTNGVDLTAPYYWAIAPDYEATLMPRYMAKRGFQLGAEVQYLEHNFRGVSRVEFLPYDEMAKRERYAINIQHEQTNFGQGVSGTLNYNKVSDDKYWVDLSSRLLQTSQTQLPQQAMLAYNPLPWLRTNMQVLRYQTLQPDPVNPIAKPYFLEPQLNIVAYKPNILKTDFSMIGQFSRFTHPDKVNGDRMVLYPQLALPIVHPAFQITPKVGLHMTKYALDQQTLGEPTSMSRTLPTFTLDSTVIFERESQWLDTGYIQTLEPRLYYVNIPYKGQSKIPVFDTGLTDFNFAQIFSENRYSGFDRVNDANQLTAGLTTRFLDANTGVERLKAMVGQRYYFKPQRVTIPGETARSENLSNFVAAATGLIAPKTYADTAWEFNYAEGVSERFSLGARFQPELGKVLSASYRYTRDPLTSKAQVDQVDIAGQWPIIGPWSAVGRYNFSLKDNQLLEAIGGLEYNTGCWAVRAVAQRLEATSGTPSTNFFIQLELTDFGSIGTTPVGLLRRSIAGYGKVNEMPMTGNSLISQ